MTNPALDAEGNIYVTFSGSRGQKVPVAIFKIDTNYNVKPFLAEMMNATAIAFDRGRPDVRFLALRRHGVPGRAERHHVHLCRRHGRGDRNRVRSRPKIFMSAIAAARFSRSAKTARFLSSPRSSPAFPPITWPSARSGDLFVTGPTTSSFDSVYKIDSHGSVSTFYRGLGRPQGLAFDVDGNLYVAASLSGKRGIVKITPDAKASLEVAGPGLVGLAFAPGRSAVLATTGAVHHLSWDVQGAPLVPEVGFSHQLQPSAFSSELRAPDSSGLVARLAVRVLLTTDD